MLHRPLFLILILWLSSIVLVHSFPLPILPFFLLTLLFLLPPLFLGKHALPKSFLIFAFLPFGIVWNSLFFNPLRRPPPCPEGKALLLGEAMEETDFSYGKPSLMVKAEKIICEGRTDRGRYVRVFLSSPQRIRMGDRVEARGYLKIPPLRIRLKGISYVLHSATIREVKRGRTFRGFIGSLRHKIQIFSADLFSPYSSYIVTSLTIGKTNAPAPRKILDWFIETGTIHILVISGTQVSLLIAFLWLLLRWLNLHKPSKTFKLLLLDKEIRRNMGFSLREEVSLFYKGFSFLVLFSGMIVFYAYLSGGCLPIQRAATMGILGVVGSVLGKRTDTINAFAISALLILLFYPFAFYDLSFQLSFLAVWGLIFVLPLINAIFPPPSSRLLRFFYLPFATSLSAQIAVFPLIAYNFHRATPIGVLANIVSIPLSFIILIGGLGVFTLSFLFPFLSHWLASLLNLPILLLLQSTRFFASIPYGNFRLFFPPLFLSLYLLSLLMEAEMISNPTSKMVRRVFLFSSCVFCVFIILFHLAS